MKRKGIFRETNYDKLGRTAKKRNFNESQTGQPAKLKQNCHAEY